MEILLRHRIGQLSINKKFKYDIKVIVSQIIKICYENVSIKIKILNIFRLCDPVEQSVDNPLDIENLFENLASNFAGVVQYNKDNSPHATITIDQVYVLRIYNTTPHNTNKLFILLFFFFC